MKDDGGIGIATARSSTIYTRAHCTGKGIDGSSVSIALQFAVCDRRMGVMSAGFRIVIDL